MHITYMVHVQKLTMFLIPGRPIKPIFELSHSFILMTHRAIKCNNTEYCPGWYGIH